MFILFILQYFLCYKVNEVMIFYLENLRFYQLDDTSDVIKSKKDFSLFSFHKT